jgi:iodotyrosine deiodinase
MKDHAQIPLSQFTERPVAEMQARAIKFAGRMHARRTVRDFSDRTVPRDIIENVIRAATSAPSGANQQPWHFVAVGNTGVKHEIRVAAELEEHEFYVNRRAGEEWLDALSHLGTDEHKPFLEIAPWLIVVFGQRYGVDVAGERIKHYYTPESVGIAMGMLITAVHYAGLVSLTHTPAPMKFLNQILKRPEHETPYLILVVGYPAENATVPDIARKPFAQVATFVE